ncbi:MAG: hypothetical protein E5X88_33390 [Mesorhizobium sp.]|nr:MAG: hypothetical protein E5X88_33390 [Mesorhizobium sp.]TJV90704.1 MAG: hypothetical protein E5X52_34865 [Mesorhizobium sp.]
MVPKTERFEMRLDPRTVELIDDWADEHPEVASRAEAMRQLVEAGLAADASRGRLNPSRSEKLIIWLLTELLKQQEDYEDQETVKLIQDAIYGGHFWALEWTLTGLFDPQNDKPHEVDFVARTMTMWRQIERAAAKWSDKDRDRVEAETGEWNRDPKFDGFDGNEEGTYFSIARFLVQNMGRFEEFKNRSLNSHSNRVADYRAMLAVYDRIEWTLTRDGLTLGEVIKILKHG